MSISRPGWAASSASSWSGRPASASGRPSRASRACAASLRPLADQAAALFYDKLFERDPGAAALFRGDMHEQGRRLMQMITVAVLLLDDPRRLEPMLHELGARHAGYGVRAAHYATVGGAWLDTLSAMLGPAFTPPTRRAWAEVHAWIAAAMQAGATAAPASRHRGASERDLMAT